MDGDKLTYWEERTINIGNYESVKCGMNYSGSVREINKIEKTVTISEMASGKLSKDSQSFNDTVKVLQGRVRKVLDKRESELRIRSERFVDTHSSLGKALVMKTISHEDFMKKHAELQSDYEQVEDLEKDIEDSVFDG